MLRRRTSRTDWRPVIVVAGITLSTALVWQTSASAFVATTTNPGSSWSTGTVVLTDDDAGTALFSPSNMKPGDVVAKCIVITYTGSLAANVEMYVPVSLGALRDYLDVTVQEGTGGGPSGSCTGFAPSGGAAFTGTLSALASTKSTYATGIGTFTPTGASSTSRTYRITTTVQDVQAAMGTGATGVTFT